MKKQIPERCCANCRFLFEYPKNNAYNDIEYLCIKIGRYIVGRDKDIDKAVFFMGDGETVDMKVKEKCTFERK